MTVAYSRCEIQHIVTFVEINSLQLSRIFHQLHTCGKIVYNHRGLIVYSNSFTLLQTIRRADVCF